MASFDHTSYIFESAQRCGMNIPEDCGRSCAQAHELHAIVFVCGSPLRWAAESNLSLKQAPNTCLVLFRSL